MKIELDSIQWAGSFVFLDVAAGPGKTNGRCVAAAPVGDTNREAQVTLGLVHPAHAAHAGCARAAV